MASGWRASHRGGISGDTHIKLYGVRVDLREIEKAIIETADGMLSEAVVTFHSAAHESPDFLMARVVFDSQCCT